MTPASRALAKPARRLLESVSKQRRRSGGRLPKGPHAEATLARLRRRLEETGGFTALITGICLDHHEDDARLQAGTVTLDALCRTFQQRNRK